ncbi:DUF6268 family outer membrane beta-barrel protein [Flavobacterium sp. KJJ]|uniref:DUF6268 family outer membrane beta-barrel protein n=1 Tax=Flavobacterium sp. KJJ TaxID=1270193 RepID=UPI000B0AB86A|nr:DUF6268 family outer membrane beta-barrel protein [Flavobacterium sp. KJJ]
MKAQDTLSAEMNLKTEPTDKIDFNETNIIVSYNKKINTENEIKNTFEYSKLNVNYEEGNFLSQENLDRFNQLQNKIEFSHYVSNSTKLIFSVTPMVNFQQNLNMSDFAILGSFEIVQQLNLNTSIMLGATRTTVFGYPKVMPILSLNYKLNNASALSIGFPDSRFSYSNNIRNKFSLTNSFNGNFYNLDEKNTLNNAEKMTLSQMTSAFEYERNVDKNWFLNFKAGYDFNKKYNLIDSDNHKVYDFNTGNGYILGIGIKYKQ